MNLNSISQLGKLRANSEANKNNNLKLAECECTDAATCEDVVVIDTNKKIKSFVFEGQTITLTEQILSTEPELLEAELRKILDTDWVDEDRPYEYGDNKKEVNPGISVTYVGGILTIKHIGAGTLSSLTLETDVSHNFTRNCTLVYACVYEAELAGTLDDIVGNLGAVALANDPYAYSAVQADADDLATDIETALATATDKTVYAVAATPNAVTSKFTVQILMEHGDTINVSGPDTDFVKIS